MLGLGTQRWGRRVAARGPHEQALAEQPCSAVGRSRRGRKEMQGLEKEEETPGISGSWKRSRDGFSGDSPERTAAPPTS